MEESYRCNTCAADFNQVEELLEHAQSHTNPERGVTCVRCQLEFPDLNDFISHHRIVHDGIHEVLEETLKVESNNIELISPNEETSESVIHQDETVNQITIVNDDGEAIGLTSCGEEDITVSSTPQASSVNSNAVSSTRKRRLPLKYREASSETVCKRIEPVFYPVQKKTDIEIDVTDLTSIRLKSQNNNRQDDILNYLQRVDEKLDCIIKHFNVPFLSQLTDKPSPVNNLVTRTTQKKANIFKQSHSFLDSSPSVTMTVPRRSLPRQTTRQDTVTYINCETPPHEITQYVISDDLLETTYLKSRNRGNFAKNLVYAAFPLEERLGRNCSGRRSGSLSGPKDPLEQAKLEAVKEAVFKKFPALNGDDEDAVWKRECVIAIDTALRSEMRTRILNMQAVAKDDMKRSYVSMPM